MKHGFVHSFETGAAVDGPGVRFALFLSGCPLRCLYCHNPDTWDMKRGTYMSSDAVFLEIKKYANFLRKAGGLTITGGDPLAQPDFTHTIFQKVKTELQLHTALDTQGHLGKNLSDQWFDPVDLVLLDIKIMNKTKHIMLTGQALQPNLDLALRLEKLQKKVWLRYVLVPGLTDDTEDIERLAQFIAPLQNIEKIEVLPFHNLGAHKWEELKLNYTLKNQKAPTEKQVQEVQDYLENYKKK